MVKFKINKNLDIEMAAAFLGDTTSGIDFGESVWKYHLPLKGNTGENAKTISDYFDTHYSKNGNQLEHARFKIQSDWNVVEYRFIGSVIDLFNGFSFPRVSILGIFHHLIAIQDF